MFFNDDFNEIEKMAREMGVELPETLKQKPLKERDRPSTNLVKYQQKRKKRNKIARMSRRKNR